MVVERFAPHDLLIRERSAEVVVEVTTEGRHPFKASEEMSGRSVFLKDPTGEIFHTSRRGA